MMNEEALTQQQNAVKPGFTLNTLKYIAIIAMVLDHTADAFVSSDSALYIIIRFIGRITGPVMFFAAAEGYHHTRNLNRYMTRLAIFALVSYLPFVFFVAGGNLNNMDFLQLNVIYTLFLGVAAIRIRREVSNPVLKILLIFCIVILSIPGDWGVTGIFMMLAFDYFYRDFKNQALGFCFIVLLGVGVINLFTYPFTELLMNQKLSTGILAYKPYIINAGQFVPIVLLYFYNGSRGRGGRFSKWFFYIFYPLQFIVLGVLQTVLK
jgi:hypothetical protein